MTTIKCIYFKMSGKYYTEGEGSFPTEWFVNAIYPRDYAKILLDKKKLPGLQDGSWSAFTLISVAGKYTELFSPGYVSEAPTTV